MNPESVMYWTETIRERMIKQGEPSGSGSACFYRSPEGKACSVGCLIPDEAYNEEIENAAVCNLRTVNGKWCGGRPNRKSQPLTLYKLHMALWLLAEALDKSNIPATDKIHDLLIDAQQYHDDYDYNIDGTWEEHWRDWEPPV